MDELDRQAAILGISREDLTQMILSDHIHNGCSLRAAPDTLRAVTDYAGLPWVKQGREWRCLAEDIDASIGILSWSRLQDERGGLTIIAEAEARDIARNIISQ